VISEIEGGESISIMGRKATSVGQNGAKGVMKIFDKGLQVQDPAVPLKRPTLQGLKGPKGRRPK
jgi:hypothetical protein